MNVILTDNDAIQAINKEYRQIDAPTDVLSFPMVDYEKPSDFDHVEDAGGRLFQSGNEEN